MAINLTENIKGAKYKDIKHGKHLCSIECADEFNKILEASFSLFMNFFISSVVFPTIL